MNSLPKPAVSPIERSLGGMEKLFYLLNQNHPTHFAMVGEVTGPTRVDQWRKGLDQVARHSPLVWSRIELDSNGVPVFRPASPGSIPLKVVHYDASSWTVEVTMQIADPFNELKPPLLRATLLHSTQRAIIILVAHHSIGDGLALTFLLGDLLRAVAGQEMVRSQESDAVEHLVARRYEPTLLPVSARAAQIAPAVKRQPKEFRRPDGSAPHVRALRLTSETTHDLRVRARAERTSVQSTLVAALAEATSRLAPEMCKEPMRIMSPVDLRRRLLDHSDHLAMCVSGIVLADDAPGNADLWTRARHFGQAFEGIQSSAALAATVLGLHGMLAHINAADDAKALFADVFANDAVVTNLGIVDLPRKFGPLVLDAVWGPSVCVGLDGEQVVGATTFGRRLHLVHTSYAPIIGLLDQMAAEVTAALTSVN
jgi:NRPS condensation-like uncharacterized protein